MIWVIGIIVLGLLVTGGVIWGLQYKNTREIQQLDAAIATLDSGEITGLVRNIEQLGLAGKSAESFNQLKERYQKLATGELTELQTALLDVEQDNKQFHLRLARERLEALDGLFLSSSKTLKNIRNELRAIESSEQANLQELNLLRNGYQSARKTVLARSFEFDAALPALEARLQEIAQQLETTTEINARGDHQAAEMAITDLKTEVAELKTLVAELPSLVSAVKTEYPAQVEEINQGYQQLRQGQKLVFPEDIEAGVAELKRRLKLANQQIQDVALTELKENTSTISSDIDHLYDVIETELSAKQVAENELVDVQQFIAHAQKQNHQLLLELDHLNQSYELNHDELFTAKQLKQKIHAIASDFQRASDAIHDHTVIYSDLREQLKQQREDLKAIEAEQQAIDKGVGGLKETEKRAIAQVDAFEMTVRDIKYEVTRQDLPGLPEDYKEEFRLVTEEIETLNSEMNQIKIDLDSIAQSLIQLSQDIDHLKESSRELIHAAGLAEQLVQYANRYKTSHVEVGQAVIAAQEAYSHFEYQAAADRIAIALEQIEPGSFKKVEDAYMAEKAQDIF